LGKLAWNEGEGNRIVGLSFLFSISEEIACKRCDGEVEEREFFS